MCTWENQIPIIDSHISIVITSTSHLEIIMLYIRIYPQQVVETVHKLLFPLPTGDIGVNYHNWGELKRAPHKSKSLYLCTVYVLI